MVHVLPKSMMGNSYKLMVLVLAPLWLVAPAFSSNVPREPVNSLDAPPDVTPMTAMHSAVFQAISSDLLRACLEEKGGVSSIDSHEQDYGPVSDFFSARRILAHFDSQKKEDTLRDLVLAEISRILHAKDVTVEGRSQWSPPSSFSLFYRSDGRHGGIHATIFRLESQFGMQVIVQEVSYDPLELATQQNKPEVGNGEKVSGEDGTP